MHGMTLVRRFLMMATVLAIGIGAAHACSHDIYCPEKWVWSDSEGTCVEAPTGIF